MAQKFIITRKGYFRLGDVHLHKDLLLPGDECYGGGFYRFDYASSRLLLEGASYDFGRPRWDWVALEGVTLKIPASYIGLQIVYREDEYAKDDFVVTGALPIEYM